MVGLVVVGLVVLGERGLPPLGSFFDFRSRTLMIFFFLSCMFVIFPFQGCFLVLLRQ